MHCTIKTPTVRCAASTQHAQQPRNEQTSQLLTQASTAQLARSGATPSAADPNNLQLGLQRSTSLRARDAAVNTTGSWPDPHHDCKVDKARNVLAVLHSQPDKRGGDRSSSSITCGSGGGGGGAVTAPEPSA